MKCGDMAQFLAITNYSKYILAESNGPDYSSPDSKPLAPLSDSEPAPPLAFL